MKPAHKQLQDWHRNNSDKAADELSRLLETLVIPCLDANKNDAPAHVRRDYTLAFEDVFNGSLDPTKWLSRLPWGPSLTINFEEEYYTDVLGGDTSQSSPFSFNSEGNLVITASPITGNKPVTDSGITGGQNYTSGVITTRDSLCFTHGYVEVCAKVPKSDGAWPATWLLNCIYYDNAFNKNVAENNGVGNDKFNPEIDFMEMVDGPSYQGSNCVKNAYHYFTGSRRAAHDLWTLDGGNFKQVDQVTFQTTSQFNVYESCDDTLQFSIPDTCSVDYSLDFHTFAVDWTPEYIDYYVDGIIVNCIKRSSLVSDQAMYLIINYAIGGTFPFGALGGGVEPIQKANPADYPASMEIEYARIYTL